VIEDALHSEAGSQSRSGGSTRRSITVVRNFRVAQNQWYGSAGCREGWEQGGADRASRLATATLAGSTCAGMAARGRLGTSANGWRAWRAGTTILWAMVLPVYHVGGHVLAHERSAVAIVAPLSGRWRRWPQAAVAMVLVVAVLTAVAALITLGANLSPSAVHRVFDLALVALAVVVVIELIAMLRHVNVRDWLTEKHLGHSGGQWWCRGSGWPTEPTLRGEARARRARVGGRSRNRTRRPRPRLECGHDLPASRIPTGHPLPPAAAVPSRASFWIAGPPGAACRIAHHGVHPAGASALPTSTASPCPGLPSSTQIRPSSPVLDAMGRPAPIHAQDSSGYPACA